MRIWKVRPPLFSYELVDPWGRTHTVYATQLVESADITKTDETTTYDNGYTKEQVPVWLDEQGHQFRSEPPVDYSGHTVYRQFNVGRDSFSGHAWETVWKGRPYVDENGVPIIFGEES